MSGSNGCTEFRELAPELALGIADGEERANALEHLARCSDCRRFLDELSLVADELLMLAPRHEPPVGFESRVVDQVAPARERGRRWWWRPVPMAAAAGAAALVTAAAMFFAYRSDHQLANEYRSTLMEANGSYFTAAALKSPQGATVGQAFAYQGNPSWVLVTVTGQDGRVREGTYRCQLITTSGRHVRVGPVPVANGGGSYGQAIPVAVDNVNELRMLGPGRGTVLEASFGK